jgi:LPS-assembly protein
MKSARAAWLLSCLFLSAAWAHAEAPAAVPTQASAPADSTQAATTAVPGDAGAAAGPGDVGAAANDPGTAAVPKEGTAAAGSSDVGAAAVSKDGTVAAGSNEGNAPAVAKDGTAPAGAKETGAAAKAKEVTIKADTLAVDVPADSYRAKGSVHIIQDGVSLLADSVIYRRLTGDALAEGNVFMEKDGDTVKGDRLSLNMISQKGEVQNGELFLKKPNFRLKGKLLQKTGDDDYHVENGTFTTCDGPKPSWRFEAKDLSVTLDDFATAHDAVFYAGDVPLLYTPYLIFPVKRERQSGLLLPKFGFSSKKGLYYDQPYYWAISPSQDLTLTPDIETSRGLGLGVDYRYIRARGSEGRLQAFGIYDTKTSGFRGEIDQKHLEILSTDTTLASNIHLITDRSYYYDYGEIAGDYNRQLLESSISLDHKWQRYNLGGQFLYSQDLLAPNNDATVQRLPQLSFIDAGDKLGPFFLSMDSGFTNFQRKLGENGQRLELHPRLALYEKPAGIVDLSLYGGYRERLYNASGADGANGVNDLGQADAGATVSLPLERIYNGRLRHLLVPSVEYGFVQQRKDDNMPFFDYNDRVLGQSIAGWSIASTFTEKLTAEEGGAPEYRDLLYLKLSQGYQFSGQRRDLLTLVDPGHRLTDLMLESKITPVKAVSLTMDGRYDTVDNNVSSANLGVEWKGEGTNTAAVAYRFSRREVNYLETRLAVPVVRNILSANLLARYSFDGGGILESRYALEYKQQCWSVIAAYAERPGTTLVPGNREFTLNFTLAGIGALGPVRTF